MLTISDAKVHVRRTKGHAVGTRERRSQSPKISVAFTHETFTTVRKEAQRRGVSFSTVVRECVAERLMPYRGKE
jgi:hypothetical protein